MTNTTATTVATNFHMSKYLLYRADLEILVAEPWQGAVTNHQARSTDRDPSPVKHSRRRRIENPKHNAKNHWTKKVEREVPRGDTTNYIVKNACPLDVLKPQHTEQEPANDHQRNSYHDPIRFRPLPDNLQARTLLRHLNVFRRAYRGGRHHWFLAVLIPEASI